MPEANVAATPVFYRNPVPLDRVRHAAKKFVRPRNAAFANHVNSVPLAAVEFNSAARNYPIVFTSGDPIGAVAVLGFEGAQNLFIGEEQQWAEDVYVPAYVILICIDQNPCAQSRSPMDMMRQGCSTSLFQAAQQ